MSRFSWAVVAATVGVSANAAPPDVTHLFPAGARAGTTVTVTAGGKIDPWPARAWCDDPAVTVEPGEAKGTFRVSVAEDAGPGPKAIRVYNAEGASRPCAFVVGTLAEIEEAEPNDTPDAPQVVAELPVVVNGRLAKAGDVDHYAVPLRAGDTLVASLTANRTLASPMDAVLQVLGPDGFLLDENHDHDGLDPQLAVSIPRDGTYVVRIFAFPETPDSGIRFSGAETYVYRLTLTTGAWADHAFPAAVRATGPAEVRASGWNVPDSPHGFETFPEGSTGERRLALPGVANPVLVRVEPHDCVTESNGNGPDNPQDVAIPVTVSGHVGEPGDTDSYRFRVAKGASLLARLEARASGSPLYGRVRILDVDGKMIKQGEDAATTPDVEVAFVAPAEGEYRVEVNDLFGHGSWRHWYRLRIIEAKPDFTLTLTADRFAGTVGSAVEIPVNVNRLHGHAGPIVLTVEGLPEGATVEGGGPITDTKAKQATLKIRGEEPFSGPIRVAAEGRAAAAPFPGNSSGTEHVWFALTPTKK